jgi:hypothetical protein
VVQELPPISAMRALFRRTSLRVAVHRNDTVACFSTRQHCAACKQLLAIVFSNVQHNLIG